MADEAKNMVKDDVTGEMMSKNALKKLQKKRAADAKKAEKKAAAEAKAAAEGPKKKSSMASAEADDQLEPHQYFANRCAAMQRQQLALHGHPRRRRARRGGALGAERAAQPSDARA